jgi:hypothetical protein
MLIDTHQHPFWHGRDDRGLVADMDQAGIDLAWLLTWEIPPTEDWPYFHGVLNPARRRDDGTHQGIVLPDLLIARDRFPGRFVLGYCPHPLLGDAPGLFEAAWRMHGARVCGEWKCRVLIDDPRCLQLFHKAGELGAAVVLHLDVPYLPDQGRLAYQPQWYGGTVENLKRALQACPRTNFIGHAPGFWREISGDAGREPAQYPKGPIAPGGKLHRLLDTYPNLYADLSAGSALGALKRDAAHARQFLERYADRLLFGRDFYGNDLMDFLKMLELSPATRDKVFFQNAQRLVKD